MQARTVWIASAVAVVGAGLQWFAMMRFEERVSGGAPLGVVVAARDLTAGESLSAELLAVREIPSAYVDLRHIPVADSNTLIGESLGVAVRGGEALLWSDLQLDPTRDADLSDRVRPGMRAVTVSAGRDGGIAEMLRPGDRVDLLSVAGGVTDERGAPTRMTRILLQNALVLAVGGSLSTTASGRHTGSDRRVTLSVTPADAQRVAEAQSQGQLTLTLRHPDDVEVLGDQVQATAQRDSSSPRDSSPPSLFGVAQKPRDRKGIEHVN